MAAFGVETDTNVAPLLEIIMSSSSSVPVSPDEKGIIYFFILDNDLCQECFEAQPCYGGTVHIPSDLFL